jgi:2-polyprenyl-3-methyl-5-hydroxy-6-metoxy-1,4-benzoquinol methylase
MERKSASSAASPSPTSVIAPSLRRATATRRSVQPAVERAIAVGYGLTYDAIVRGFEPYETLIDEVVALVARGAAPGPAAATRVLDVSCGIGSVAGRVARRGWTVVGLDAVAHLVAVARRHHRGHGPSLSFHHADVARDPLPAGGAFDVLVSVHTLYWHPDPAALLTACRRALKPGGHAVFLTYQRPARVVRTFAEVRRQRGWWQALRALRWLVPTAVFDLFRGVDPRYLTRDEFDTALRAAGFEVLERRDTFLAGISLLAWTRAAETSSQL